MLNVGVLGLLFGLLSTVVTMTIAYFVIRFAVRDGLVDGQRRLDAERVRGGMGLGPERSPNSRV